MFFSLSFLRTYITYVADVAASLKIREAAVEPGSASVDKAWSGMMADNGTNNSDNEQILAMPELNEPVGVPEWNEAMGMPEWDGAESSDYISVDSLDVLD